MRIAVFGVLLFACSTCLAAEKTITVAADGSGDFKTIQEAVAAVPENSPDRTILHIKPGTYQGQIFVPKEKQKVTFDGDDAKTTVITFDKTVHDLGPDGKEVGIAGGTSVIVDAPDFQASNITFQNTAGDHGQALALRLNGDREVLQNCRLLGWQDTLLCWSGRDYFKDCYIEGRVDFIYGGATAVFDHCEIHSKNGGHVTAASTPQDQPFGFVFLHCTLTGDDVPWKPPTTGPLPPLANVKRTPMADLGRPWRPYAAVAYLYCEIGSHIKPEGWNNWRNPENEKTARYAEYRCTGPGADRAKRVAWSKELTDDEAAKYTIANILGGKDGWNPASSEK